MKRAALLFPVLMLALAGAAFAQLQATGGEDTPDVGSMAPDYGIEHTGDSKILLAFFPAAFTPGWTREFTEFGENYAQFQELGIEVVGISTDSASRQSEFAAQVGAAGKVRFVSDEDTEVIRRYGALSGRGAASRYYFLIDEDGTVIWKNVTGQLIPVEALLMQLAETVAD